MAAGDIVSVEVHNSQHSDMAEVTISGLGTGGTYDFGLGANNDPATGTPKVTFTIISLCYDNTGAAEVVTRTSYGTVQSRVPINCPAIPGTYDSGTFIAGETVTQANTGATGTILFSYGSGTTVFDVVLTPTSVIPDNTSQWTGGTSNAKFTSAGAADTKGTVAGMYYSQGCTGNSGTFQLNEACTQAGSGAAGICKFAGAASGSISFLFVLNPGSAAPNASGQWTGTTSNAKCTPGAGATPAQSLGDYRAQEWYNGTNTVVRFALSRPLYQKDATGGGNSGTAPVVSILSGFYTKTGTPNNASGSNFAVTNSSTRALPAPFGQWDGVAGVRAADRVSGDFYVAFNARLAAPEGIACVKFDIHGVTSGFDYSVIVTEQTAVRRTGTGKYVCCHRALIPISGFTSGESITLRARLYPGLGDSILDTDSHTTATEEIRGKNKATIVYNTTVVYGYVNQSTGNNTTGTVSSTEATAAGAPHLNIGECLEDQPTLIKLSAGNHAILGDQSDSQRSTSEWVRVVPADGLTSADVSVTLDSTATSYKMQRLQFENVTVKLTNTNSYLDGDDAGNFLRFKDCPFDGSGVGKPTRPLSYRSNGVYFDNCTGDLMNNQEWNLTSAGTDRHAVSFDGCQHGTTGDAAMNSWYRVTACIVGQGGFFAGKGASNPAPTFDNVLFENNTLMNQSGAGAITLSIASISSISLGASICGNLIERVDEPTAPGLWLKGDLTALSVANVLVANNTIEGCRCSIMYSDTLNDKTYTCERIWFTGNVMGVLGTKHDTSATSNFDSRNTQIWNVLYGTDWSGNISMQLTGLGGAGIAMHEFIGLRSYQPAFNSSAQPRNGTANPLTFGKFVDRKASTGSGTAAGNGDYRIYTTSPAYRALYGRAALPYDMNGKPRSRNRDSAGCYALNDGQRASMFFAA